MGLTAKVLQISSHELVKLKASWMLELVLFMLLGGNKLIQTFLYFPVFFFLFLANFSRQKFIKVQKSSEKFQKAQKVQMFDNRQSASARDILKHFLLQVPLRHLEAFLASSAFARDILKHFLLRQRHLQQLLQDASARDILKHVLLQVPLLDSIVCSFD